RAVGVADARRAASGPPDRNRRGRPGDARRQRGDRAAARARRRLDRRAHGRPGAACAARRRGAAGPGRGRRAPGPGGRGAPGVAAGALDAIVVGTASSEFAFPSFACLLQARLGADPVPAFDVAAACAGFLYGLGVADSMLRAGPARTILLVGADALGTMVARD